MSAMIVMAIGALSALSAAAVTTVIEPIRQFGTGFNGNSVAFHPTEPKVVLSTLGGAVIVDLTTGGMQRIQIVDSFLVDSVAFSPDGALVLTGLSDNTVRLWDAATGSAIRSFEGHTNRVRSVAFSPDGAHVLTGSVDNTARLWDAATGAEIRAFEGHTDEIRSVAFSPDGAQILTGSLDGTARLWNAATGAEIRSFELDGHTARVYSVAFSPDGTQILTGSVSNWLWTKQGGFGPPVTINSAKIWDTVTGAEVRSFDGHSSTVLSVAFSPDGAQILSGSMDNTARLWDAATGIEIRAFEGHTDWINSVVFSPDGAQVLTGSNDQTARLWDAATANQVRDLGGHTSEISSVAFSSDGARVLTGAHWPDSTARLWDVDTGTHVRTFEGLTDSVYSVAFSPNGTQVLTGAAWPDTTARLWDVDTGGEIRVFQGHTSGVRAVAFSPDGAQVLTGSYDTTARLWDAGTGTQIRSFVGHTEDIHAVAFSPDGTRVLTGSFDTTARLWDAKTGGEIGFFGGHWGTVWSVAFSPDGTKVLTGSPDSTARLWDAVTGNKIRTFEGHGVGISFVAFSPDGALVFTQAGDGTVQLWDTNSGGEIRAFESHTPGFNAIAISPDGARILTGSSDRTALLWPIPIDVWEITPAVVGPTHADVITFSVRFMAPVVNFESANDVIIDHSGTAHTGVTITGGPILYTVAVEGITGDGAFTLAVNTNSNIESLDGKPLESSVTSEPVLIDNTPPVTSITTDFGNGPGADFTTSITPFVLMGATSPDTVEVRVNGEVIAYTPGDTQWAAEIDLNALGPVAQITVVTVDGAGNESAPVSITITYDPTHDADGNGLTDQEEHDIAHLIPTDPLDPLLPRSEWHVSAANGSDALTAIQGGGTEQNPWRTIRYAMEQLAPLAREHFPLRILLDDTANLNDDVGPVALYEELSLAFIPYVSVEPADMDGGPVHIRPVSTGGTPVIAGAAHTSLRGVVVRPALNPDQGRALLQIINVPMTVEDVVFDGLLRQNSTGIDISGLNSSDSLIRGCSFINLGTGLVSTNSGVAVSDNTFSNISANSSASRAIAIGFTVMPGKQGGQAPVLGDPDRILDTGFNRFRGLPAGANAIEFINVPLGVTSAQYNDWGVYTEEQIRARISSPFKDATDAVDISPFIPQDKAIIPGGITGVILNAETNAPIPLNAAPGAFVSDSLFAMAESDGLFFFDLLPEGTYTLFGRAQNHDDSSPRIVRVSPGRVSEAPRFLLEGEGVVIPGVPGDINGSGVVNAVDVQLVINAALGVDIDYNADINGDGVVNAVDVQLVINAALGVTINP